eukprot:14201271-Ditylum_brightwellii.AAC.1
MMILTRDTTILALWRVLTSTPRRSRVTPPSRMKAAQSCPTGSNTRLKIHHPSALARDAL